MFIQGWKVGGHCMTPEELLGVTPALLAKSILHRRERLAGKPICNCALLASTAKRSSWVSQAVSDQLMYSLMVPLYFVHSKSGVKLNRSVRFAFRTDVYDTQFIR